MPRHDAAKGRARLPLGIALRRVVGGRMPRRYSARDWRTAEATAPPWNSGQLKDTPTVSSD